MSLLTILSDGISTIATKLQGIADAIAGLSGSIGGGGPGGDGSSLLGLDNIWSGINRHQKPVLLDMDITVPLGDIALAISNYSGAALSANVIGGPGEYVGEFAREEFDGGQGTYKLMKYRLNTLDAIEPGLRMRLAHWLGQYEAFWHDIEWSDALGIEHAQITGRLWNGYDTVESWRFIAREAPGVTNLFVLTTNGLEQIRIGPDNSGPNGEGRALYL